MVNLVQRNAVQVIPFQRQRRVVGGIGVDKLYRVRLGLSAFGILQRQRGQCCSAFGGAVLVGIDLVLVLGRRGFVTHEPRRCVLLCFEPLGPGRHGVRGLQVTLFRPVVELHFRYLDAVRRIDNVDTHRQAAHMNISCILRLGDLSRYSELVHREHQERIVRIRSLCCDNGAEPLGFIVRLRPGGDAFECRPQGLVGIGHQPYVVGVVLLDEEGIAAVVVGRRFYGLIKAFGGTEQHRPQVCHRLLGLFGRGRAGLLSSPELRVTVLVPGAAEPPRVSRTDGPPSASGPPMDSSLLQPVKSTAAQRIVAKMLFVLILFDINI